MDEVSLRDCRNSSTDDRKKRLIFSISNTAISLVNGKYSACHKSVNTKLQHNKRSHCIALIAQGHPEVFDAKLVTTVASFT